MKMPPPPPLNRPWKGREGRLMGCFALQERKRGVKDSSGQDWAGRADPQACRNGPEAGDGKQRLLLTSPSPCAGRCSSPAAVCAIYCAGAREGDPLLFVCRGAGG